MDITPQQIVYLLEQKQFDRAISLCQQLENKGVVHPQLWLFMALAHGRKGEITTAEKWFSKLTRQFGANSQVHYNRGLVYQENGLTSHAIQAYMASVQMDKGFAPAWHNLGLAAMQEGQDEKGIEALKRAAFIQPENQAYRRHLAEALSSIGALAEAVPHWEWLPVRGCPAYLEAATQSG